MSDAKLVLEIARRFAVDCSKRPAKTAGAREGPMKLHVLDHTVGMRLKQRIFSIVFLAAATSAAGIARAGEPEIRSCDFAVKARCASGDARVTLIGGVVQRVQVNVIRCGLPGHPNFTCTIDSSRGDKESKWSDDAGAAVIANASPFNPNAPDRVKLTVGTNVSIDLGEAQSLGRCGAGAELPRAIVISAHSKTCRVWLPAE